MRIRPMALSWVGKAFTVPWSTTAASSSSADVRREARHADIAGHSPAIRYVRSGDAMTTLVPTVAHQLADLTRIARSAVPVVLLGETGTGKEVPRAGCTSSRSALGHSSP